MLQAKQIKQVSESNKLKTTLDVMWRLNMVLDTMSKK
jgi:hypothetical protein